MLEQPRGSLLEHHPLIQQVFRRVRVWRQHVRMIEYAASTDKGTWLYSSAFDEYGKGLKVFFVAEYYPKDCRETYVCVSSI